MPRPVQECRGQTELRGSASGAFYSVQGTVQQRFIHTAYLPFPWTVCTLLTSCTAVSDSVTRSSMDHAPPCMRHCATYMHAHHGAHTWCVCAPGSRADLDARSRHQGRCVAVNLHPPRVRPRRRKNTVKIPGSRWTAERSPECASLPLLCRTSTSLGACGWPTGCLVLSSVRGLQMNVCRINGAQRLVERSNECTRRSDQKISMHTRRSYRV